VEDRKGVVIVSETSEERQKAHRVLEAAVAEAGEKPNEHVFALPVMRKASVSNREFRSAARYLDEQGWIAEGAEDYETFVVTPEGMSQVTGQRGQGTRDEEAEDE
jgi:hypothetical protein